MGGVEYQEMTPKVSQLNGIPLFVYPANIENEYGIWVEFNFIKYKRPTRDGRSVSDSLGWVVLPPPQNLANQHVADWSERSLGFVGSKVADLVSSNSKGFEGSVKELARAFGSEVITAGVNNKNKFNIIEGISAGLGVTKNPFEALLFEKMQFRTFNFEYKFSPRNMGEFLAIQRILYAFKYAMHPSINDGSMLESINKWIGQTYDVATQSARDVANFTLNNQATRAVANAVGADVPTSAFPTGNSDGNTNFNLFANGLMDYPNLVIPKFSNNGNLFDFHPCAITNLSVNFHGEGSAIYIKGKVPASITINITLQEVLYNIKDDIARNH